METAIQERCGTEPGEVFTEPALYRAWERVAARRSSPGYDKVSIDDFNGQLQGELRALHDELVNGDYRPRPLILFPRAKPSGGIRELAIACVRDRVASRCLADHLTRRHDGSLLPQCYAYRPGRGAISAAAAAQRACLSATHVVRVDIAEFFDSLRHDLLASELSARRETGALIDLVLSLARAPRFDGVSLRVPDRGIPQGLPLAPVLSNLYLHPLDVALDDAGFRFIRYADDLVLFTASADEAQAGLGVCQSELGRLALHPSLDKTRVYPMETGFLFLGFLYTRTGRVPARSAVDRLHQKLAEPRCADDTESTYRTRTESIVRGWNNYFQPVSEAASPNLPHPAPEHSTRSREEATPAPNTTSTAGPAALPDAAACAVAPGDASEGPDAGLARARGLMDAGRYQPAANILRRILNDPDVAHDPDRDRECFEHLAHGYSKMGLRGAAAQCLRAIGRETPSTSGDRPLAFTTHDVEQWMSVFGHGIGPAYRQFIDRVGRSGFRPASDALHASDLREHWEGRTTLAVPVYGPSDTVRFAAVDLDVGRKELDHEPWERIEERRRMLLDDARGLLDAAHRAGVDGLIEDSGYKGYHAWFFFDAPVSATVAHRFLSELCRVCGAPPDGTHRELFPATGSRPPDGLGCRLKIPLGIHRLTGRRCAILDPAGTPCSNGPEVLHSMPRLTTRTLHAALQSWSRYRPASGGIGTTPVDATPATPANPIALLRERCPVLKGLAERAATERTLSHTERIVLRGILEPVGTTGCAELHRILGYCDNYDRRVTNRFLGRPDIHPMSCRRIREALGSFCDEVGCACRFRNTKLDYDHPLRHLAATIPGAGALPRRARPQNPFAGDAPASAPRLALPVNHDPARQPGGMEVDRNPCGEKSTSQDLTALLSRFHSLARNLLEVQAAIAGEMKGRDRVDISVGTLVRAGPDTRFESWKVEV